MNTEGPTSIVVCEAHHNRPKTNMGVFYIRRVSDCDPSTGLLLVTTVLHDARLPAAMSDGHITNYIADYYVMHVVTIEDFLRRLEHVRSIAHAYVVMPPSFEADDIYYRRGPSWSITPGTRDRMERVCDLASLAYQQSSDIDERWRALLTHFDADRESAKMERLNELKAHLGATPLGDFGPRLIKRLDDPPIEQPLYVGLDDHADPVIAHYAKWINERHEGTEPAPYFYPLIWSIRDLGSFK